MKYCRLILFSLVGLCFLLPGCDKQNSDQFTGFTSVDETYKGLPFSDCPFICSSSEKTYTTTQEIDATGIFIPGGTKIGAKAVPGLYPDPADLYEKYSNYVFSGSESCLHFKINPSNFDVSKANWSMYGYDKEWVTKTEDDDEPMTWYPSLIGVENKDGVLYASYKIQNVSYALLSLGRGYQPFVNFEAVLDGSVCFESDFYYIDVVSLSMRLVGLYGCQCNCPPTLNGIFVNSDSFTMKAGEKYDLNDYFGFNCVSFSDESKTYSFPLSTFYKDHKYSDVVVKYELVKYKYTKYDKYEDEYASLDGSWITLDKDGADHLPVVMASAYIGDKLVDVSFMKIKIAAASDNL